MTAGPTVRTPRRAALALALLTLAAGAAWPVTGTAGDPAAPASAVPARQEVIYGRKYGTALTMDVFTPAKGANGAGALVVVSGGWYSGHERIDEWSHFIDPLLAGGYTVFAVVHGSNPKFSLPE